MATGHVLARYSQLRGIGGGAVSVHLKTNTIKLVRNATSEIKLEQI